MTEEQRQLWLDLVRGADSAAYNEPLIVRFTGSSSVEKVARSFEALVERHEALRTSFHDSDGELEQVFHDRVDVFLPPVDLSHLPVTEAEAALRATTIEDAGAPFDLDQAPLLRARIFRLGETDHRLALTFHHILLDGRSVVEALSNELPAIHAMVASETETALPQPFLQYGDYAVWQRRTAQDREWDAEIDFWKRMLADGESDVALPYDRPHDRDATRVAATESVRVGAELVDALERLSQSRSTSLYAVLLAAFMTQLRRYSRGGDITVGSVVDTRSSAAMTHMIGYCLNTVALRGRPEPEQPFDAFVDTVRDMLFDVYENAGVPFDRVAQSLDGAVPGTSDGRFCVMFSMQPRSVYRDDTVSIEYLTPPRAKADLHLELELNADGLEARFTYDRALFDEATVRRIAGHWAMLLDSIAAAPENRLGDLAILPAQEADEIAVLGRGVHRDIPDAALHELIAETIVGQPDALAITCGDTQWTYAELDQRANAVAEWLVAVGVEEGALVAICLDRTPHMISAVLGTLRAGAAYVPLDPSFPAARLATIFEDADPAALLSDSANISSFEAWGRPALSLDEAPAKPRAAVPVRSVTPDSLAYVIYTSGSTGVPKGVEIEHRGVVNVVGAMRHDPGFSAGETMLAVSRLTFDMSVPDIFLPLIAGGTIAIASSDTMTDPRLLAEEIERTGCTLVQATPATWQNLITDGWTGKPGLKVLCGGEALGRSLADALIDRGVRLWNGYGPTETTIYTTMEQVERDRAISIGRPIDNVEVRILDDRGHDVPCNVVGHLCIGGPGLARRYRDPDLTSRAFFTSGGTRLYRSGDLALRRPDGRIEWLGRSDFQVKIRGFRIDVGDVEAAICSCPGVGLAAVRAVPGSAGAASDLAAYIVPRAGEAAPEFTVLRRHLKDKLPAYMIPTRFMVLDAMPLSSSGKIRRDVLPPIDGEPVRTSSPDEPPVGDVECRVAAIWRELLGIETVGATDDFFDLGGHSLLAARLVRRLSDEYDQRLPLATLLRAPTIRKLAAMLAADTVPADAPRTVVIGEGRGRPLFWIDATPNFRVNYFRDFAAALGDGISLIGLPVDTERFASEADEDCMATITADMADTVLAVTGDAPSVIGGWCNGGVLALAVANEVQRRGGSVETVVLLDSANQALYRKRALRIRREVAQLFRAPSGERIGYLQEWLGGYLSRARRRFATGADEATALLNLTDRYMRIIRDMPPPVYAGRVVRIEAAGGVIPDDDQWKDILLGHVEVVRVPGGHQSVLHPPYVEGLAAGMASKLFAED